MKKTTVAVVALLWLGAACVAQAQCEAKLGQARVDYGVLRSPAPREQWQGPVREVLLTVACDRGERPGFHLQAPDAAGAISFGGLGEIVLTLGDTLLDGRPVALLRRAGRGDSAEPAGGYPPVNPGDTWVAPGPGRWLQVQLLIDAKLPPQAWQVPDEQPLSTELVIRAL
ncbi:hypothetical protein [Pseudomonas typographi]|uniref:hypothetical protein n=1 Tax=Pseudomonas typographi TaxID=2715964 RepID=UPI001681D9B6|nr:hypothetical protein [Pseudomonas typographi]MBD1585501.1 hypothetical protein [Pseudomonas typographi]